jgi:four helix bundle protein
MVVRRYQEFHAWQLSEAFSAEVYRLVLTSKDAREDRKYYSQILNAADGIGSNIAEGFLRFCPGDFSQFLGYAVASLAEAERRLINGVSRGYFTATDCAQALRFAKRATVAIVRLKKSQRRDWKRPGTSKPRRHQHPAAD